MTRASRMTFLRVLLMLIMGLAFTLTPNPAYAAKTSDIGVARTRPLGSIVTVKGTVAVASGAFVSSTTEGRLVVVKGAITKAISSDLPYGYKFYVNDGSGEIQIFVAASTNLDLSHLHLGQQVRVTGLSAQFDTTYEVQPRVQTDIRVLD